MSAVRTVEQCTRTEKRPEEDARQYVERLCDEGRISEAVGRRVVEQLRECRYGRRDSLSDDLTTRLTAGEATDGAESARTDVAGSATDPASEAGRVGANGSALATGGRDVRTTPSDESESVVRRVNYRRLLLYLFACLPLGVVALNLTARVPAADMVAVEVAHYYQALALVRDGLDSYFYVTLQESFASAHLYSLLASPLVGMGYTEGGRLVSYAAAVLTAVGAGYVASTFYDHKAGVLTLALLFANPFYRRFTWSFAPEGLGIALTTLAVATTVRFLETDADWWYALSLCCLCLGVFNHLWEATIALPMTLLLVERRRLAHAVGVGVLTGASVVTAKLTTRLQPQIVALSNYSVFDHPLTIFLSPEWWAATHPLRYFFVGHSLHLWLGLFFVGYWGLRRLLTAELRFTLLFGWTAAGLAVPILLPKGHVVHDYYLWGLAVPVSMSVAFHVVDVLTEGFEGRSVNAESVVAGLVVMLALGGAFAGAVYDVGVFEGTGYRYFDQPDWTDDTTGTLRDGEYRETGRELRQYDVDAEEITFVGDWKRTPPGLYWGPGRILIYGDVLADHFWMFGDLAARVPPDVREAPSFAASPEGATDCRVMVVHRPNGETVVRECPRPNGGGGVDGDGTPPSAAVGLDTDSRTPAAAPPLPSRGNRKGYLGASGGVRQ